MAEKEEIKIRELILLIIVIILLILCIITSFRTGQKFFEMRHSDFGDTQSIINSDIAKFHFDARIVLSKNGERNNNYEGNYY